MSKGRELPEKKIVLKASNLELISVLGINFLLCVLCIVLMLSVYGYKQLIVVLPLILWSVGIVLLTLIGLMFQKQNILFYKNGIKCEKLFGSLFYKYNEFQRVVFNLNKELSLTRENGKILYTCKSFSYETTTALLTEFSNRGKEVVIDDIWHGIYTIPDNREYKKKLHFSTKLGAIFAVLAFGLSAGAIYANLRPIVEKTYYPSGVLNVERITEKGTTKGIEKMYDENGKLMAIAEIKNKIWNGIVKIFYENGNLEAEDYFENGKPLGPHKTYYPSGALQAVTEIKDGKPNGIMKGYYENGKLKVETNLVNGEQNGIRKEYYESGVLSAETNFKDGKENGLKKTYYESGALYSETNFKDGEKDGLEKSYYESGIISHELPWVQGKSEGIAKRYYENGKILTEIQYQNDERNGFEKRYYENGKLEYEGNNKNGKSFGIMNAYSDDGMLSGKIEYKDGKLDGAEKSFYQDGSLCEILWKQGEVISRKCLDKNKKEIALNGTVKFYYKNGNLNSECEYLNQKLNGICKIYYTNGKIKRFKTYKNDKLDGEFISYDMTGQVIDSYIYKDGKKNTDIHWINGERNFIFSYNDDDSLNYAAELKNNRGVAIFYDKDGKETDQKKNIVCDDTGCKLSD